MSPGVHVDRRLHERQHLRSVSKQCVAAAPPTETSGGCATTPGPSSGSRFALLGLGLLSLGLSRARRRQAR